MYVCMYVCMYVYNVCMYVCIRMYTYVCMYVCMYIHIYACMCVCVYTMCVCVCVHCVCVCVCVCVHILYTSTWASKSLPSATNLVCISSLARTTASSKRSRSFTVSPERVLNFLPSSPCTRPKGTCSSLTCSGTQPARLATCIRVHKGFRVTELNTIASRAQEPSLRALLPGKRAESGGD
jgi:hypothetical protein